MKNEKKISELTKILIYKTHGGRKKDSKFWNNNINLDKKNLNKNIKEIRLQQKKKLIKSICLYTFIICGGALFVIGFWTIFYLDYKETSISRKIKTQNIKENIHYKNKTSTRTYSTKKKQYPIKIYRSNNNFKIKKTSLTGKIFSWFDKKGTKHYSNTNYPQNNPTLKVQNEIKKENSVTKISIKNGQIFIPVTFKNNGKKLYLNMVLDTGCSCTNVPYKYLNRLGVKYTKKTTSIIADGSKTYGRRTKVDMMKVGPNQEYDFNINGSKVAGSHNKGLLGLDFLKKHPFKIDFNNEFIVWD